METRVWHKNYDPGVPRHLELPEVPVHRMIEEQAARMPRGTAVTLMGAVTTYEELNARANRFAHALIAWGIRKGDRVALVMANSPNYAAAQLGVLKAGATAVPVNPLYTGRELSFVLSDAGARFAVVLSLFAENLVRILDQTVIEKLVVVPIPGLDLPLPEVAERFDDFLAGRPETNPDTDISPDDPAVLLYTGGTTGRSKGAILHHRGYVYNCIALPAQDPQLSPLKDSFCLAIPFFHIFGNVIMMFCLASGLPMHLVPQPDPTMILQTIHDMRPTWFPGVPTMFIGLMNHPEVKKYDLTSIRYCISGAAPFPVEPMERFEAITGCRVVEVFGMTESGAPTHFNPFVGRRKMGSVGMPIAEVDARIVDIVDPSRELGVGQEGQLLLKGPAVMKGYLNMPDETRITLIDSWLYTGDVARMDEDGYFWIVDRMKDLIIAGGFNIFPREIDEVLHEHPKVEMACAVGVPDPYRGETVKAFIVPKSGQSLTEEEITAFCRERLAAYKVPKLIEFRESLPTSIIGKVLRRFLRDEEKQKNED